MMKKGVVALSKIPAKDVLLAQLVGSLQGPIQGLVAILKAVADSKSEDALNFYADSFICLN